VPFTLRGYPASGRPLARRISNSEKQASGFGAYSLTYIGPDLEDAYAPDGVTPGRWWTHYFNSSPVVREYAAARGVPATAGTTTTPMPVANR
jgi:hypothetical protein